MDYRDLNEKTIKNRYPLTLIKETLMLLSMARYLTKLGIKGAQNLIRMAMGDKWKMELRTQYRVFKDLVIPFGMTNAPATFWTYINETLSVYLARVCFAFLDDTIVYSMALEEHIVHIRQILKRLLISYVGLHLNPKKCAFHQTENTYLGLTIGRQGIRMQAEKVQAIQDWKTPSNLSEVHYFYGFENFYRRFIHDFFTTIRPLAELTRKHQYFHCNKDETAYL